MATLTELQVEFLGALGKMEERVEGGKRRIDVEEGYLEKIIDEAKKSLVEIQKIRHAVLVGARDGAGGHSAEIIKQAIIHRCKNDIVYWINNFCYLMNPHITKYGFPVKMPFVMFPKQEQYVLWKEDLYKKNRSGLVYKCRDMGVSWLNVTTQAWHWLFEAGFQGRIGSLKAEEVDDKNDPDSLMQKLRVIIYNTPWWMRPEEFWKNDNKYDTIMKLYNPMTQATISGQQGDNMGRGGRASMYDVDEWAKIQHDKLVDSNLSSNSPCRIYTGTPMGRDNDYAEKYASGMLPIFSFDYWDDPRKTKDWFDNYDESHDEAITAQEVLKSFDAFKGGTAIPGEWVNAAASLWEKIKDGEIVYSSDDKAGGLDVAAGGRNRTVMLLRNGIVIEDAHEWNLDNTTMIARHAGSVAEQFGVQVLNFDPISVGVGVKSTFDLENFSFRAVPVDYRGSASEVPLYGDTRPARERCLNRRAELAMIARKRFENTYEFIAKGIDHPIDSMVAIPPGISKLRSQLSLPERFSQAGKWRLEPKEQMVKRGVESPDYFDAFMLCMANDAGDVRVAKSFNPKRMGVISNEELPIMMLTTNAASMNYVSIYHSETLSAAAIGGVWLPVQRKLVIYDEFAANNTTVMWMVNEIRTRFKGNRPEYVGNKAMFGVQKDDLFMQYLDYGIMLNENHMYDELSAIALLNQMFDMGQITIHKRCNKLLAQLEDFSRSRGVPKTDGMEVVLALCNLLNTLKEYGKLEEPVNKPTSYLRRDSAVAHRF